MSASDLGPVYTDSTLFNTLYQTLEADLTKKACKTLKKAVADPICASVKQSIRDSLGTEETGGDAAHTETTRAQFRTTFEDTISDAVCAALKQAVDDTACSNLKRTIHYSFELALRRERIDYVRFVPSVTPALVDSFCAHLEQITGNAVCAALKQAMDDTVCEALKKGVHRSFAQLASHKGRKDDIADTPELSLDREFSWHVASDDAGAADAFSRAEDAVVKEVCNRLKAAVTSMLCRLLQQTIKDTIAQHSTECKAKCQRAVQQPTAYEKPRTPIRSIALVFAAGIIVASLLAATVVPGAPLQSGFNKITNAIVPTTGPSNQPGGGGSNGGSNNSAGAKTATQLDVSFSPNPAVSGQSFTISAVLQANGSGVANVSVALQQATNTSQISFKSSNFAVFQESSEIGWTTVRTATTDSAGKCQFPPLTESEGNYTYRLQFSGSDTYQAVDREVSISVTAQGAIGTTLSLSVDGRTVSGSLTRTDTGEGLANETISLALNDSLAPAMTRYESTQTSSDGSFSYKSETNLLWVQGEFQAQENYLSSSQVWVGWPTPPPPSPSPLNQTLPPLT
jgi:hypothetical protein